MADNLSVLLPQNVLRNLADKLYEKRKNAALEVESVVKQLSQVGDRDRINAVIALLISDFVLSPQANHRKGGLIGLAAATVGLANEAPQHLERIVPSVLKSFQDQDSRVRYYACEALYNIAKVSRGEFIIFFNDVFDALCKLSADSDLNNQNAAHLLDRLVKDIVTESEEFSIEEFIPLLKERMHVLSPNVRQFLVGWITVLDSVPDIDMLGFLPDFLDGLFNMLGDSAHEIRVQADSALREFLQEIKNAPSVEYGRMAEILVQRAGSVEEFTRLTAITWIHEFVKLGGNHLVPYYAAVLGAVLPCISDKEEKISAVAKETNDEQLMRVGPKSISEGFDIGAVLTIVRRELSSEWENTRLEALRWIVTLLDRFRPEVLVYLDDPNIHLFSALLQALSDSSDKVVLLVLEVLASVARDRHHFHRLLQLLVQQFNNDRALLEKRGSLALRQLCVLLDAEKIYRELAAILETEPVMEFATVMVQALNLILLTASELSSLRSLLKKSLTTSEGRDFFLALHRSWCHSPVATISLCMLAQAYGHSSSMISSLGEDDITVNLLVQVDKLVHLLETPIFTYLRLQLLEPGRYPTLLKTLYGLLMLLPQQSNAFKLLRTRLKSVPTHAFMHIPLPSQRRQYRSESERGSLGTKGEGGGEGEDSSIPLPPSLQDDSVVSTVSGRGHHLHSIGSSLPFSDLDKRQGEGGGGEQVSLLPLEKGEIFLQGETGELQDIDFEERMIQFEEVQNLHRERKHEAVGGQRRQTHGSTQLISNGPPQYDDSRVPLESTSKYGR